MRLAARVVAVLVLLTTAIFFGLEPRPTQSTIERPVQMQLASDPPAPAADPSEQPIIHQPERAENPIWISVEGTSIDHPTSVYTDKMVEQRGGVNPLDATDIAWWAGGGRPGATPENTEKTNPSQLRWTTYLYGHTGHNGPAVFDEVRNLEPGAQVTIATEDGVYIYAVQSSYTVSKTNFSTHPESIVDAPGRLLLISCWRPEDYPKNWATVDNVVAVAQMVEFRPANSSSTD